MPGDQLDGLGGEGVAADERHVGARDHHLAQVPLRELQRVVHEFGRGGREFALFVGFTDEVAQLLQGRAVVELLDGFDADAAQQPVGDAVEDMDHGADDPQVDQGGGGEGLRHALGHGEGEVLGGEFAEDHLDDGRHHERQHHGDARDQAVGEARAVQGGPQEGGDGRFREEADDEPRDGDAELRAGQHEGEPLQHLHGAGGPLVPGGGLPGEGQPVGGDVGELLGHEVAGPGGEDEHGQEAEQGGGHRSPVPRGRRRAALPGAAGR